MVKAKKIAVDEPAIRASYQERISVYEALKQEVVYILEESLHESGIKIDTIEKRIKAIDSIIDKARRKGLAKPFDELLDVVGARVVCLFRSDLDSIEKIIENRFVVISKDDKIHTDSDAFGYMSVHYICEMRSEYVGPRYDKVKGVKFEVQVRTICMHAWAAVSHYLDYKSEWDAPKELRKALNALSGLFYVADSEFEQVYRAKGASRAVADVQAESSDILDQEINFETLSAYLERRFPDRRDLSDDADKEIAEFVTELRATGYARIAQLDHEIQRAEKAFLKYEKEDPPAVSDGKYVAVGVARVSLELASEDYRRKYFEDDGAVLPYLHLVAKV